MVRNNSQTKEPTKSDVIREILREQPQAAVNEIRTTLHDRGVKASDALINKIKYGRGRAGGKKSRRRGRVSSHASKADAIRTMLDRMGSEARSRDVIAALAKRGVKVSSAQVSTLRKSQHGSPSTHSAETYTVSLDQLVAAKHLADRVGGIDMARHALSSLAKLLQS